MVIGKSATLSAKNNDNNKAKMTICCFEDIVLKPYSYISLGRSLRLSSYIGYAIYIEAFGDIIMERDSHIDIHSAYSENASIFIKCRKLIMGPSATINVKHGEKITLVISDKENRIKVWENSSINTTMITPSPQIFAESTTEALGNVYKAGAS